MNLTPSFDPCFVLSKDAIIFVEKWGEGFTFCKGVDLVSLVPLLMCFEQGFGEVEPFKLGDLLHESYVIAGVEQGLSE